MHFLLVAGGILTNPAQLLPQLSHTCYDVIVAVDHGYDHCVTLGLTPTVLMGDLDSITQHPTPANGTPPCKVVQFNPEKDDTDLRLAVDYALTNGANSIDITCATGGRLDQFLGNLSLLEYLYSTNPTVNAQMIDEQNVIRVLAPAMGTQHFVARSKYISLIPIDDCICFSGEGLKYPAQHLTVQRTRMISISNESLGDTFALTLHQGKAFLVEAT